MADEAKKPYISVYNPIAGWKAIMYWWNPELGGYWEPYQTGMFAHKTRASAVIDAKLWAAAEELEYKE